ncbi:MAG: ferritin family protein, partial [Syntrophales bacterium]|nr:ferritin family protein [Syntrophales bacterium]
HEEEDAVTEQWDAFEKAIKSEMLEGQFYEEHAVKASHSLIKVLFEWMASEEWAHHKSLKKLHAELQAHGKLPDDILSMTKKTSIQDFLEDLIKKDSSLTKISSDDLIIVRKAIVLEEKVTTFYEHLRDKASDPKDRALFETFLSYEHEHLQSLKYAEAFLAKSSGPLNYFNS